MSNLRDAIENVLSRSNSDIPPAKRAKFEQDFAKFLQLHGIGVQHEIDDNVETNLPDDVNIAPGGESSSTVVAPDTYLSPFQYFEHQFSSDDEDDEMAQLELNGDQVFVIDEDQKNKDDPYPTTAKKMEIIKKLDAMKTPKTLKKLQHHYRNVSSLSTVYQWKRKILENGGLYKDKLIEIDSHVFQCFKQNRADGIRVHDRSLIRWGMEKARELNMDFRASNHWLLNFKKRHNIKIRQKL